MKYKEYLLKDIATITMGQSPKSQFYNEDGKGIEFLQGVRTFGEDFPSFDTYTTHYKRLAHKNSILFSVRAPVGRVNWATKNIAIGRGVASIFVQDMVYDRYVYYYFKKAGSFYEKKATGTIFTSITKKELESLKIKIPASYDNQKMIADRLAILDKKIHLNQQINANFTDQIKTISNSLFSYFEAFNGKMPGDWHYEKLTDIANIDTGYSYKGNELKPSSTAMATIKNFNRKGGFNIEGFKEIRPNKDIKSEKYAKRFDILVAHTDLTQNADIIGNAEPILDISNYTNVIYSMDLVKVTTKDNRISQFLLSLILQGEALKAHCLGYINGTTVLHLSKKALKQFEIPLPNDLHDLDNIDKFARKAYLIMGNNLVENRYLQSIKNELLEKYF